jgi:hypothetical protein
LGKFWKFYAFFSVISSNFATFSGKKKLQIFHAKNLKEERKGEKKPWLG